jgi:hypothetical protein
MTLYICGHVGNSSVGFVILGYEYQTNILRVFQSVRRIK